MSISPDHEEALQKCRDFEPYFTPMAQRHRRTLVQTRYGLRSGDLDVKEAYESHLEIMDGLLDILLQHKADFTPEPIETIEEVKQRIAPSLGHATVRFQLSHEPIPEYHDQWIVIIPEDQDYGSKW